MDLSVPIQCRMFWKNRNQWPMQHLQHSLWDHSATTSSPGDESGRRRAPWQIFCEKKNTGARPMRPGDQLITGPKYHISYITPSSSSPEEPARQRANQASAWLLLLLQPLPSKCPASLTTLCLPMRNNPAEYMFLKGKTQKTDSNDLLSN